MTSEPLYLAPTTGPPAVTPGPNNLTLGGLAESCGVGLNSTQLQPGMRYWCEGVAATAVCLVGLAGNVFSIGILSTRYKLSHRDWPNGDRAHIIRGSVRLKSE